MGIAIQKIDIEWTKQSRGAEGATKRNKVPERIQIDLSGTPNEKVLLHLIKFHEYNGFGMPEDPKLKEINKNQIRELGFEFELNDNQLEIMSWIKNDTPKRLPIIRKNKWLQIKQNSRGIYGENYTIYKKNIYNIFFGDLHHASQIINSTNPIEVIDYLKPLY